jgi:peptide deformylase
MYARMAILKIARMGHPVLLARAAKVPDPTAPEISRLLADMVDTLEDAGGVGLAAPQVFNPLRLFIYQVPAGRGENEEEIPLSAVINPVITPLGPETVLGWEGCLSIPGLRAAVPRYRRIRLTGLDPEGRAVDPASPRGWRSMKPTIWMAFCTRCGWRISAISALTRNCSATR